MIVRKLSTALAAAALIVTGCAASKAGNSGDCAAADGERSAEQVANLKNFDDLDFRVYTGRIWGEFSLSHADDIIVHYPDASITTGIDPHLDRLKPQFAFAPDSRIEEHPIRLADGNFTAVQGVMQGTFTEPMDLGNGVVIQPTGKSFKLEMATIGRWEDGKMQEEWLYWDNAAFMKQIGLGDN